MAFRKTETLGFEGPASSTPIGPPPPYPGPSTPSTQYPPLRRHPTCFAPCPDGTPGPSLTGDNPKGFKQHVKNFAPGKSPSKLLDPPPASFARPPHPGLHYEPFHAMELMGKGNTLDDGFSYVAPPCQMVPHPFVTHDVNEHDWQQFLHDLRIAGSLSPSDRIVSGVLPMVLGFGFFSSLFATFGMDHFMRRRKRGPVSQLIDHWNNVHISTDDQGLPPSILELKFTNPSRQFFFHPRCIHVALSKGSILSNHGRRRKSKSTEEKWHLVVSYRPYTHPTR
ncbi:hypothetical protein C8Q78DRAFT_1076264 [Trametes maxima]|nr:hypothetical protein C8Q78DRAFT_1076264 [Trametes maxima]